MTLKRLSKKMLVASIISIFLLNNTVISTANSNDKIIKSNTKLKNVILLIGDGMGYNQVLAGKYYDNRKEKTNPYDKFKTQIAMSTYSLGGSYNQSLWNEFDDFNNNPTDSAAAATAVSTGTKTHKELIGLDKNKNKLRHIFEDFEEVGKSTGVVTSVPISHATPAGFIAHNTNRHNYSQIANEMLKESSTDVIMGAGNPYYDDNGKKHTDSSKYEYKYVGGRETWEALENKTLDVGDANGDGEKDPWILIQSKSEFENLIDGYTPQRVIGVAQVASTLQQRRDGNVNANTYEVPFNKDVVSLDTMTMSALNILDNNDKGFFLMIEGGAIDWTGHANQSGRLIEEVIEFNNAIYSVFDWVSKNSNWSETLVIVTGDHECGYLTGTKDKYTNIKNNGKGNMPTMFFNSQNHTNQLVPFYVKGRGEELFKKLADEKDKYRGNYIDNTDISKVIRILIK